MTSRESFCDQATVVLGAAEDLGSIALDNECDLQGRGLRAG